MGLTTVTLLYFVFDFAVGLFALLVNGLVLMVLYQYPNLRKRSVFLTSMLVADILTALCTPLEALMQFTEKPDEFETCVFLHCLITIFITASMLSVCCMSMDRCLMISCPDSRLNKNYRAASMVTNLIAWVLSFLVGLTPIYYNNKSSFQGCCDYRSVIPLEYNVYIHFMGFTIPVLLAMLVMHSLTFYSFYTSLGKITASQTSEINHDPQISEMDTRRTSVNKKRISTGKASIPQTTVVSYSAQAFSDVSSPDWSRINRATFSTESTTTFLEESSSIINHDVTTKTIQDDNNHTRHQSTVTKPDIIIIPPSDTMLRTEQPHLSHMTVFSRSELSVSATAAADNKPKRPPYLPKYPKVKVVQSASEDAGSIALGASNNKLGSVIVLKSLAVIFIMYFLCRAPLDIFNTVILFHPHVYTPKQSFEMFLVIVSHLNPIINPILFCLPLKAFKRAMGEILASNKELTSTSRVRERSRYSTQKN